MDHVGSWGTFLGFAQSGMSCVVLRTVPRAPNPNWDNLCTRAGLVYQLSMKTTCPLFSSPFSRSMTTWPDAVRLGGWLASAYATEYEMIWSDGALKPVNPFRSHV